VRRRAFILLACVGFLCSFPAGAWADGEIRWEAGGVVGLHFSLLTRPADPRGSATLLQGSGFSGWGYLFGFTGGVSVPVSFGELLVRSDLVYANHQANGYAEDASLGRKREVSLEASVLHIPVLLGVRRRLGRLSAEVFAGPELLLGLKSAAEVQETNLGGPVQPLLTTPVSHVGVSTGFRLSVPFSAGYIPIDCRVTWDPSVGDSTEERFEGFHSKIRPGSYRIAFDLNVVMSMGYQLRF
jgi:hypothetical protein